MNIKLINGTENPEQLVCTAARNDYRSDGVIDHSFEEIMEDVDPKYEEELRKGNPTDTQVIDAKMRTLIDHLMERDHWGPFEHPHATVALEGVTRVSMAQITRHRHFTFDIMSLRYVQPEAETVGDRFKIPEVAKEDEAVSREGVSEMEEGVDFDFDSSYYNAMQDYEDLLDKGVPKEEARKVLPMGTKVNIVMSGNARAWMHLLNIRGKANVQGEARRIAEGVMDEMQGWMPYTFHKYEEEILPRRLNP